MESTGRERIADTLSWKAAVRSDLNVARLLRSGEEPDGIYGLGHTRIVDAFFCWLDELGVLDCLRSLPMVGVHRAVIPPETHVLVYFLRCLARIPSQEALPDLVFSDPVLMEWLGFSAHQIEHGLTRRGDGRRRGPRKNLPVDPEAVSKYAVKLDVLAYALTAASSAGWTTISTRMTRAGAALSATSTCASPPRTRIESSSSSVKSTASTTLASSRCCSGGG